MTWLLLLEPAGRQDSWQPEYVRWFYKRTPLEEPWLNVTEYPAAAMGFLTEGEALAALAAWRRAAPRLGGLSRCVPIALADAMLATEAWLSEVR
jgi:hypothetical protein